MALPMSLIGTAIADTTTVTIPVGHQIGDLIFIYAFRGATTAPTLPSGWNTLATTSSGASSHQAGYKYAGSSSETSGTWTNASGLMCVVIRGATTRKQPMPTGGFGFAGGGVGTASTLTTAGITITPKNVMLICCAAQKTTANNLSTTVPITGMLTQANLNGATNEYAIYVSNGLLTHNGAIAAQSWSVGSTSAEYRTYLSPVFAEEGFSNNYQHFDVGDGMSSTEKIV